MAYFEFPHTREYEGDLGYIIKKLLELTDKYNTFFEYNSIRFHDPITWNISESYPAYNIVYDEYTETLYISKQPIPAGIAITNEEYWEVISPFHIDTVLNTESPNPIANKTVANAIEDLRAILNHEIEARGSEDALLNSRIDNETSAREQAVSSLNTEVSELSEGLESEITTRAETDATLASRIDSIIALPDGSTTADAELIDIRTSAAGPVYASAGDAVRAMDAIALNAIEPVRLLANTETGLFGAVIGAITATGANNPATNRARTNFINLDKVKMVTMIDSTYTIERAWTYDNGKHAVRSVLPAATAGTSKIVFIPQSGEEFLRVSFYLTSDDTHTMTSDDTTAISDKLRVYTFTDPNLNTVGAAADAKTTGDLISSLSSLLDARTVYEKDVSNFSWTFGGVAANGKGNDLDTRIRLLSDTGLGGFSIGAGSTITANEGYKFNVAIYSEYYDNNNFKLIGFKIMDSSSFTADQNCFIRVSVGTTTDDILWTENSAGIRSFTEEGLAAQDALNLNLVGTDVKTELANIENDIKNISNVHVFELDSIPKNAVDYHDLWNDFVTAGLIERELLINVNDDADLPLYLYKIRHDMNYMSSNYDVITWDGSNELYKRPKILLTSGIHGNERTTPYALFDFVSSLLSDPAFEYALNAFEWYIIPLINPWGFSHSAFSVETGNITNGSGYNSSTISDYTIEDNTDTIHQGIRRNLAGIDINRDFTTFATEEAQAVRDAISSILDTGEQFAFAIDAHQANNSDIEKKVGAFLSLQYNPSAAAKDFIYTRWMQVGAITESLMNSYCNTNVGQSVYPWNGSNLDTIRNYLAAYTPYSMCFEGAQTCMQYSQSSAWSNAIARAFIDTQYHYFLKKLLETIYP